MFGGLFAGEKTTLATFTQGKGVIFERLFNRAIELTRFTQVSAISGAFIDQRLFGQPLTGQAQNLPQRAKWGN